MYKFREDLLERLQSYCAEPSKNHAAQLPDYVSPLLREGLTFSFRLSVTLWFPDDDLEIIYRTFVKLKPQTSYHEMPGILSLVNPCISQ